MIRFFLGLKNQSNTHDEGLFESESNSYQEKARSRRNLVKTIEEKLLLRLRLIRKGNCKQTTHPLLTKGAAEQFKRRTEKSHFSGRLSEGEVHARSDCFSTLILSKREIEKGRVRRIESHCTSGDERSRSVATHFATAELESQTATMLRPGALQPAIIACDYQV